ncbi:glucoamylase [Ceraceosorus bombacis]|uniref:glucan 1,4-alpha-glucosidase n=1 Tax=Ceraceosorus bombacis TaxID=401625 RepID=A0A0P1BDN8_9BASI|nr:glucoamylase [Ceraceosorus bombacis]
MSAHSLQIRNSIPLTVGAVTLALGGAAWYLRSSILRSPRNSRTSHFLTKSTSARSKAQTESQAHQLALTSLTWLVAAFGPDGRHANDTAAGCMIASPSRPEDRPGGKDENESYYFQWSRDSGLCARALLGALVRAEEGHQIGIENEEAQDLHEIFRNFVEMSIKLQSLPNPSGTYEAGGLGEPKFNVDGSAFQASWGRPQNDGPALRALAALRYAIFLQNTRPGSKEVDAYISDRLWAPASAPSSRTLIRDDLDYVARVWETENSFELWEEVEAASSPLDGGGHFHVLMSQKGALEAGAAFAKTPLIADEGRSQSWDGHYVGNHSDVWSPWSERAAATLYRALIAFQSVYKINEGYSLEDGILVGRYPEDVYNGVEQSIGHPWFLTTHATAELLYITATHWLAIHHVEITAISLPLYKLFDPHAKVGKHEQGSSGFRNAIRGLRALADKQLERCREVLLAEGRMDEQIERFTGKQRGARHLSWSYASYLSCYDARHGRENPVL